ncbi:MAG: DUF2306 domain-containing protein [Burkholderiaceae bacterium]
MAAQTDSRAPTRLSEPHHTGSPRRGNRRALILMALAAVGVALASYRFVFLGLEASFFVMLAQIEARPLAFLIHVAASPIALAIGAIQFFPRLRTARPRLHRWLGRLYGLAILAGGLAGLVMAPTSVGGPVAGWGFGLLAVIWIAVTAQAVRLAMAGRFDAHRRWMIRSYALTFAAVTLRIYLPFFMAAGIEYPAASVYLAWLAWVPNLVAVEWWLRRRGSRRREHPSDARPASMRLGRLAD